MNTSEFLLITTVFMVFLTLRFGVPIMVMWLLRLFCTRVLHAQL